MCQGLVFAHTSLLLPKVRERGREGSGGEGVDPSLGVIKQYTSIY